MEPAGLMPWWITGILAPTVVALVTATVGAVCWLFRAALGTLQQERREFLDHLKSETERGRTERAEWLTAFHGFREDMREHTAASKAMYRMLEHIDGRSGGRMP